MIEKEPKINSGDRVIYHNPGGYDKYAGTVTRVFEWGKDRWWADINWDLPVHPCTTPMEIKHLILVNAENQENEK